MIIDSGAASHMLPFKEYFIRRVLNNNRRVLGEARRHKTEEVQGLRASLEKAQKEVEEQRLADAGQQRTSTQVEEEQHSW